MAEQLINVLKFEGLNSAATGTGLKHDFTAWADGIKLFTPVIYYYSLSASVGLRLLPSLRFAGKAEPPRVKYLSGVPL